MEIKINLPKDMYGTLMDVYNEAKKYDASLTEELFYKTMIKQFLYLYRNKEFKELNKNNVKLKNNLKLAIQMSGKTQVEVSKNIGISKTHLSQIINGVSEPSITIVLLIANRINYPTVKLNDLFFLESIP